MANPNPQKRRPGEGESWRPSIYLPREVGEAIRAATEGMTTQERSRALGRWLMLGWEMERQCQRNSSAQTAKKLRK